MEAASTSSAPLVRAEALEGEPRVRRIIIDNPGARNGLTAESAGLLAALVREADADPEVRAIVLTGAGGHFCSGADLREGAAIMSGGEDGIRRRLDEGYHAAIRALAACKKPTLAVIRGAAVGFGFDLALACDLRLAASDAVFAQVFAKIGLVPDGGSSFTLSRLVGVGKALELFLLGERVLGAEAERLNLVNRAVAPDALEALAEGWARRLAQGPPLAFAMGKANVWAGAAGTLEEALLREREAQAKCATSRDAMLAVKAFFAKETPRFEGR